MLTELLPGWVGIVLAVVGLPLIVLCLMWFSILKNLPVNIVVTPLDEEDVPGEVWDLVEQFADLGFEDAGPPLRAAMMPPATVVPLWHPRHGCYGSVIHAHAQPPKRIFDFVSVFDDETVSLTSVADVAAGVLPPAPRELAQILPGQGVAQLFESHCQGGRHLEEKGLRKVHVKPDRYVELLSKAIRTKRAVFQKSPLRCSAVALWRTVTKRVPMLGPIETQALAQRQIADLRDPFARRESDEPLAVSRR